MPPLPPPPSSDAPDHYYFVTDCNYLFQASGSEDRFRAGGAAQIISDGVPGAPRGGPPQPLVQRRSFDTSAKSSRSSTSDSWSFFNIGSSRNKRKLPSGRETISDFSCRDRPPGYYADMKLGCEVSVVPIF